jgi:capsular polysaccharide biosynthesis protein
VNDDELEVNDDDQTAVLALYNNGDSRPAVGLPERLWEFEWATDDLAGDDEPLSQVTSIANFGFIRTALRRRARFWCLMAVLGLIIGVGLTVEIPPASEATTSLLITNNPNLPAGSAILDDQAILESRAVAAVALKHLGLNETPATFATTYTVTDVTQRVLQITAKAKSADGAVAAANALASAFLTYQDHLVQAQNQLISASLQQQVDQAQQGLNSLNRQVSAAQAESPSPARNSALKSLQNKATQATAALVALKSSVYASQAANLGIVTAQIKGSIVLDAAVPVIESKAKRLLLYGGGGVVGGLFLGLAIVIFGALLSDRLRRRDDVARAFGGPVRLSVGKTRLRRGLAGKRGLAASRNANVRRVSWYLERELRSSTKHPATLAVVPVDQATVPAVSLAALALTCARRGLRVVLADLCDGSPAARLLGPPSTGVRDVTVGEVTVTVVIPEGDDALTQGPLGGPARPDEELSELKAACASADVVLTLIELDPSFGGDHLASWTDVAVAVVTAGRSSVERISGVGEMIRLAGINDLSAVLVGADKGDESLGTVPVASGSLESVTRAVRSRATADGLAINGDRGSPAGA